LNNPSHPVDCGDGAIGFSSYGKTNVSVIEQAP
jgi:hypothetical protein